MNQEFESFYDAMAGHQSISGTSLIVSYYGDYLWTCGGGIWLGSLIQAMETLGLNQRVVRSSVFRLNKDGWLTIKKVGRKSYYYLEPARYNEMLNANKKIYHSEPTAWNKRWNIIHTSLGPTNSSKDKVRYLQHKGFGLFDKDFFVQPDLQQLTPEIKQEICENIPSAKIFQQAELYSEHSDALRNIVSQSWDITRIEEDYQQFSALFSPVWNTLKGMEDDAITPVDAFKLRLLVIHFYRRIIVKDPYLPAELLPREWPRQAAEQLTVNIYRKVHAKALEYLIENSETPSGTLPLPSPNYYIRFGGLS
ncbi:PaaX family transcriptional regulator C-terminal domain-containing protein [Vibrio sp. CAU 1672]|uniref:PaaX family transcriptional regulator C-terminal domain-containing protein n=1 Tax=Vibrio sp. CAU 1672 TaxID=3032594 RepID=UPI0023DBF6D1|nr:PaaX family transcriptional regulator C-terminal domain-containing protein [Vibrio sp. CAU 1672]MDF2154596.1 PaaX family transcriptional regulator C-terminal domain-containing protein [Vibrio sp. CAU 1672]